MKCINYWEKCDREGFDWCEMADQTKQEGKNYLIIAQSLKERGIEKKRTFARLPSGSVRSLISTKDDTIRVAVLDIIADHLREDKHVSAGDVKAWVEVSTNVEDGGQPEPQIKKERKSRSTFKPEKGEFSGEAKATVVSDLISPERPEPSESTKKILSSIVAGYEEAEVEARKNAKRPVCPETICTIDPAHCAASGEMGVKICPRATPEVTPDETPEVIATKGWIIARPGVKSFPVPVMVDKEDVEILNLIIDSGEADGIIGAVRLAYKDGLEPWRPSVEKPFVPKSNDDIQSGRHPCQGCKDITEDPMYRGKPACLLSMADRVALGCDDRELRSI